MREKNNFSTLMAFLGGINNAAVMRLKWTRASISKKASEVRDCCGPVVPTHGFAFCLRRHSGNWKRR